MAVVALAATTLVVQEVLAAYLGAVVAVVALALLREAAEAMVAVAKLG